MQDAADHLRLNPETVRQFIRDGVLCAERASGGARAAWRISADELQRFADLREREDLVPSERSRDITARRAALYESAAASAVETAGLPSETIELVARRRADWMKREEQIRQRTFELLDET